METRHRVGFGAAVLAAGMLVLLTGSLGFAQAISYTHFFAGPAAPVFTGGGPGAWDEFVREKLVIIEDGGVFKMWYVGHTSGGQTTSKVGYATSPDGITWTRHPGNPVVDRPSQDQDISVLKLAPDSYWMYIEVNNAWIDLMTSSDGIRWTPYAGNPVRTVAASPVVWREGSNWFMLYEHMPPSGPFEIYLATSADGRNWADSPLNPVLSQSAFCAPDSIVKDGDTYHLYYHEADGGAWHATSTSLTSWTNRTLLLTDLTSPYVMPRPDGELWSYVWANATTPAYYLRYGRAVVYPLVWPLDEASGSTIEDAAGQGVRGRLAGDTAWTAGVAGSALTFDGIDDYVATDFRLDLPAFTVAAWVRSPAAPLAGASSGPVHRNAQFQINWNHPDPAFRGAVAVRVGGNWYAASFGVLEADTWHHLAATYDGETLCAYKNGVLVGSNTRPSGPADPEEAALALGRHASAEAYFRGMVDEVRLYDRSLGGADVAALLRFDPTPPSAPPALVAQAIGQIVNLSWTAATDAESGIGSYRIYRGTTSGTGKNQLAQVPGTTLAYPDNATLPNTIYYYQVGAVNGAGLEGPWSHEASASPINLPPAAPAGLVATAGNGQVTLDWSDNVEGDLAGYRAYRGTTPGGPYGLLTPSPLTASRFADDSVINDITYRYVVTAVDQAGFESPNSGEASATPRAGVPGLEGHWAFDEGAGTTAQDSSGRGLTGTLVNGPIWITGMMGGALSFDGVDDAVTTTFIRDLAAWTVSVWVRSPAAPAATDPSGPVQREANFQVNWNHLDAAFRGAVGLRVAGHWHAASFGPLSANTWYHLAGTYDGETLRAYKNGVLVASNAAPSGPPDADTHPLAFGRNARRLTQCFRGSIDDVRLWSRALGPDEIAALAVFDQTPPIGPAALAAAAAGQVVTLQWTAASDPESGINAYRVFRGVGAGASKTLLAEVSGSTLTYADAATLPGVIYSYQVAAVNRAGVEGPRSPEAVALTANDAPPPPTGLTATAGFAQVSLHWTPSPAPDVAGYRLYRGTIAGGPYQLLSPSLVAGQAYTDASVASGTTYRYVVTAVDQGGLESPNSNEASATPGTVEAGIEGHWMFDEVSGTVAHDASGHDVNGTLLGGPTWTTGLFGGALGFDGVDDLVTTTYTRNLPAWTVSVWVRSPAPPGDGAGSGPVQRDANFQINWNHPDGQFRGAVALRVAGRWHAAGFGRLEANTWYHLAGTYDGETLRAYRDGILVSANPRPSGPPDQESNPLVFGRHTRAQTAFFRGTVDDVRIWNRVLDAPEIAALAAAHQQTATSSHARSSIHRPIARR